MERSPSGLPPQESKTWSPNHPFYESLSRYSGRLPKDQIEDIATVLEIWVKTIPLPRHDFEIGKEKEAIPPKTREFLKEARILLYKPEVERILAEYSGEQDFWKVQGLGSVFDSGMLAESDPRRTETTNKKNLWEFVMQFYFWTEEEKRTIEGKSPRDIKVGHDGKRFIEGAALVDLLLRRPLKTLGLLDLADEYALYPEEGSVYLEFLPILSLWRRDETVDYIQGEGAGSTRQLLDEGMEKRGYEWNLGIEGYQKEKEIK